MPKILHENELTWVTSVIYTMHAVISEYEIILTNQLIAKSIRGIVDLTSDINSYNTKTLLLDCSLTLASFS